MKTKLCLITLVCIILGLLTPVSAQVAFRHVTNPGNVQGHITTLDHPQLNGNPNAILQVTADYRTVYNASNVGVWYNGTKWTIFNQDIKPLPNNGLQFNVLITSANASNFIHVASAGNIGNPNPGVTRIDHPLLNNNPNAILIATQNYGQNRVYNTSEIAVWYTGQYWNIFNENRSNMPVGASFNISIITPPTASIHLTAAANIWGQVSSATETAYADAQKLLFITHNGTQSDWNPNPCGVYFPPGRTKWSVLTGNTQRMPERVRFNIAALDQSNTPINTNIDLTGFYRADNGSCGQTYIRQIGDRVYWFGEHPDGSFAHIFSGTISGNTLSGNLWDVPKGRLLNKGNCVYTIAANGSSLTKTGGNIGCNLLVKTNLPATLPASKPMQPGSGALTGVWDCNDGAATYVREDGSDFLFFSEAKNNGTRPGFSNLYIGKRSGNTITGTWVDVPKGTHLGSGNMTLRVESDTRFVRADAGNGYGGGIWTRGTNASRLIEIEKLTSSFFIVPKKPGSGGDNDFFGHGPKVDINVSISLRSGREIWARITMKAEEQGGGWPNNPDGTCAEGTKEELIYRAPVGVTIEAIMSPISSLLSYFDGDHEEDYILPGLGERRPEKWWFPQANTEGLVFFARVVGDQNGQDIGVHTGTQVFFNTVMLRVRGQATSPSEVVLRDYFGVQETCGSNSCASSAGSTMMSFYNRNVTCEEFKQKLNNRGNLVTQFELGTPPGTLRDQLRDYGLNVQEYNMGNNLIPTLESTIRSGKPVIILTGWGSKSVRGYYAPGYDTNSWNENSSVHYVVVYGFDPVRRTFCISDNGYRDIWTYQYLQEMVWFHPELQLEILLKSMNVWPPGKAIY